MTMKDILNKFNWGWRIAVFYSGFVLFMFFLAYKSYGVKTELVTPDYYKEELAFEEIITAKKNLDNLPQTIDWEIKSDRILFQFPAYFKDKVTTGTIYFYRPSDKSLDKKIEVKLNENLAQEVMKKELASGIYQLKLKVEADGKSFYKESMVTL